MYLSSDKYAAEVTMTPARPADPSRDAELTVAVERSDGPTVLRLTGELDLQTISELRRRLRQAIGEEAVSVDLTEVTFLDSAGAAVLAWAYKRMAEHGGRLTLTNPGEPVRRRLRLLGLTDLFDLGQ